MKKQFNPKPKQLLWMGFKKRRVKRTFEGKTTSKTVYYIPVVNGEIYCNPSEEVYKWYLQVTISDLSNYIHLNIENEAMLRSFMICLQVKFTYIF